MTGKRKRYSWELQQELVRLVRAGRSQDELAREFERIRDSSQRDCSITSPDPGIPRVARLTFFRSVARGLHVPATLPREPTKHEARKRRANERPRVACCEELGRVVGIHAGDEFFACATKVELDVIA